MFDGKASSQVEAQPQVDHFPDTGTSMKAIGFLAPPTITPDGQGLLDRDIAEYGYVRNVSRLWIYQPGTKTGLFELMARANVLAGLNNRQRAILIAAYTSAYGDSYRSLVWGANLAEASDADIAAAALHGDSKGLGTDERVVADWARMVARDPNGTSAADVQRLRDAGFGDPQLLGITLFIALRLAFSTVNNALGVLPDGVLRSVVPAAALDAVGRAGPIDGVRSGDRLSPDQSRTFVKQLAADAIASGDATGWFETLYASAEQGKVAVPWADLSPNRRLLHATTGLQGAGRAIVVGCGLGDDAEHVASLGYATVAFDISTTAIAGAQRRFRHSKVEYLAADLLSPPVSWLGAFDLVVEIYTLQVLTGAARRKAFSRVAQLVAPGGRLLVIAGARDEHDHPGTMPWPLTQAELASFEEHGLVKDSIVDFMDDEGGTLVRRWHAWFTAPTLNVE